MITKGGGKREGEIVLSGYRVSVLQDENVPEISCTAVHIYLTLLHCTPKNS